MRILGLVPARAGSKGIPRKNVRPLAGKELLCYSVESGLNCPRLARVIVSTDDAAIAAVARRAGAEVPFLRPAELATDTAPTLDTVVHAIRFLHGRGDRYDAVCLLQPTVPFRDPDDLVAAIDRFVDTRADSLISVREVPHIYNPRWVYERDPRSGYLRLALEDDRPVKRRQDLPPAYHRDGSVYLSRTEVILDRHSLYGDKVECYIMHNSPAINIDHHDDWAAAEAHARTLLI